MIKTLALLLVLFIASSNLAFDTTPTTSLGSRVKNFLSEKSSFLSSFIKNPKKIGSITPSSSFLAEEITKYVDGKKGAIKILEVGSGTGVFAEEIIKKMEQDYLMEQNYIFDVIEIDPDLCTILKEKFKEYDNVKIHCVSILDWKPDYSYDFIISGLPFNSFDSSFVQSILDQYRLIIKDGGMLSYFEYIFISRVKKLFLRGDNKVEFSNNLNIREEFIKKFDFETGKVFLNFPPAYVHHLKIDKKA